MRRIALVLTVALIMVAMLAASALPAMAANGNGPPCEKARGLEIAHERAVPPGNPAHEHIPCEED